MSTTGRRQWLRIAAAGSALPLAQVLAAPAPAAASAQAFLTADEARFLAAAVDRLIPQDDWPSASQAGVVTYIDRQLAGDFGRGARMYLAGPVRKGTPEQGYQLALTPAQVYRESLEALLSDPAGRGFPDTDAQQQDAFLEQLEAGAWLLGRVPSSVFFETLLANTVEGYFADPLYGGNRDMAGWRMIGFPGAYAHYTQWVGRHNVRFNRPPVAIASPRSGDPQDHGGHGRAVPASARPQPRKAP